MCMGAPRRFEEAAKEQQRAEEYEVRSSKFTLCGRYMIDLLGVFG